MTEIKQNPIYQMLKKIKKLFSGTADNDPKVQAFNNDYTRLKEYENNTNKRFELDEINLHPCLDDNTSQTSFDRHYIYHPAWAARIVRDIAPEKHIDISSTLNFCAILSAFIPVEFYDYRPANLHLGNLKSSAADLLNLPFATGSVASISCMHTVEHVGLGRYGDPMDYDGDIKAINELKRVVALNGSLLFVVPLGAKNMICFNAHRIYTKEQVLNLFTGMELKEFTLIPEDELDGGLVKDPSEELLNKQFYGCGCFWFSKTN